MRKLAGLVLAVAFFALPTFASADGSCGKDFTRKKACAINSPERLHGRLTTKNERDYYVFRASKPTKLRIRITAGRCFGVTVSCPDVRATVYDSRLQKIGTTGAAEFQIQPSRTYSHTLSRAGTYYIIVTGHLGTETPVSGGPSSPVPSAYKLSVKASPKVIWPARHRHA
jgi:hypothetical protein